MSVPYAWYGTTPLKMLTRSISRVIVRTCAALATTVTAFPRASLRPPLRFPTSQRWLSSADKFTPAAPPGTHGTPVFSDLDLNKISNEARRRREDPQAVYVVTGASRGIGLQFIKALAATTQCGTIVACCRRPDQAVQLNEWRGSLPDPSRIDVRSLDLTDQASIEELGAHLRGTYDRVDILLNVAGLLGNGKTDLGPERTITRIDRGWMEASLAVNVIGPVMLTKELVPLLTQPRRRRQLDESEVQRPTALVANLSARVGSISDNGLGGWYSYRLSKAALNQATRTMALELGRQLVWCVALHPGTTNTDLSAPFQANVKQGSLFPVEFTVKQLLIVMDAVHAEHSGGFYDWAGQAISF